MATKRALVARSIHVRVIPRPSNLSESREILRVLRRFGKVSMFKYMKYEYQNPMHNVALAIFSDAHAAQRALDASPIRFALEKVAPSGADQPHSLSSEQGDEDDETFHTSHPSKPDNDNVDDILRPSQLLPHTHTLSTSTPPPPSPAAHPMPFDSPSSSAPDTTSSTPFPERKVWKKSFLLTLDHSRVVHADFIERQPYYKQFAPMRSLAQQDLARQVPHPGLSDVSKRPPGAFRTPRRVLGIMRDYVEKAMPSLRKISEGTDGGYGERKLKGRGT